MCGVWDYEAFLAFISFTKLPTWPFPLRIIFNTVNTDSYQYLAVTQPEAQKRQRFPINFNSSSHLHYGFISFEREFSLSSALLSFTLSAIPQPSVSACYLGTGSEMCKTATGCNYWDEDFRRKLPLQQVYEKGTWPLMGHRMTVFASFWVCMPWTRIPVWSSPSDRECTAWARMGFLTLVKELFLARQSEKDKSLAQIPN